MSDFDGLDDPDDVFYWDNLDDDEEDDIDWDAWDAWDDFNWTPEPPTQSSA